MVFVTPVSAKPEQAWQSKTCLKWCLFGQRPLDYKIGTQSELWAVLTEPGWVVSGPMTGKRRKNVCHFAVIEDVKVTENIQTWWDIETYASKINVVSQSKKKLQAQKMLESTTKFTCERYEVGMLWREPHPELPNNYSSALSQFYSLERRLQRDPNLKKLHQQSIDTDVEKEFVKILGKSENKGTFGKEWYLPQHPVLNTNKPCKVHRVCNAAEKYKNICLNGKLLAWPDLLNGLIATILRLQEGPIRLNADVESMFCKCSFLNETKTAWDSFGDQKRKTCANFRVSTSHFWSKEFTNMCKLHSEAIANWHWGRVSNCSGDNPKQLLDGWIHQVSQSSWWSNQCFQAIATSSAKTWIRTKKVHHQV